MAAFEYVVLDAYDETAMAGARAAAGRGERAAARPPDAHATFLPSGRRKPFFTAGRVGEIVALCSVAVVLAGTAARAGPHGASISTPTLAAATDTATPVGAVATPAFANRP